MKDQIKSKEKDTKDRIRAEEEAEDRRRNAAFFVVLISLMLALLGLLMG